MDPSTSTRMVATQMRNNGGDNINHFNVHKIIKEQSLYPFHVQRVQELLPRDFETRLIFCNWICQENNRNDLFIRSVLFSDEATFTRNGVTNIHNTHVWADENPAATIETHHQVNFKVNVWMGIVDNFLLGPVFLPLRLNAQEFLLFLQNNLADLLDGVPLMIRQNMWFQLDGAPPHYGQGVRNYLSQVFPNRWIGRGQDAPIHWPCRSPDLNPLDFSLWGFMKDFVYKVPIQSEQHLRERIVEGAEQFRLKPHIFQNTRFSLIKRARQCIHENGGHFEHLV